MMTVGDQGLPRRQVGGHRGEFRRVGECPQPVPNAVRCQRLEQRRPARRDGLDQPRRRAGRAAVVQQEDGLEVCLGGLHQLPPPDHRAGHHVLVRQHDPGVGRDKAQRADQPALQDAGPGRARAGAGVAVLAGQRAAADRGLLIHVQPGILVRHQDLLVQPVLQGQGGVGIDLVRAPGRAARQDQPDHVVRIRGDQLVLDLVRNDVVRW